MIRGTQNRAGTTLVELLVATAMCILGMWMLTWMFQQASNSFSIATQQVTLTREERMVTTILTRDLEADRHLEDDAVANRGRKLSDYPLGAPRRTGYFWTRSRPYDNISNPTTAVNHIEASGQPDGYGFYSSRSTDHFLQFTAILKDTPGNRYYAEILAPPGPPDFGIRSQAGVAAEVSYYLVETGQTNSTPPVKVYDLMRMQRLVAVGDYDRQDYLRDVTKAYDAFDLPYEVMVTSPTPWSPAGAPREMHTLANLAASDQVNRPNPRFAGQLFGFRREPRSLRPTATMPMPSPTTPAPASRRFGEDRLMSGVVSFEVKYTGTRRVFPTGGTSPEPWPTEPKSPPEWPRPLRDVRAVTPLGPYDGNSDFPYDNLPYDGVYDTVPSSTGGIQTQVRITGIQIRIRAVTGTSTRQTTITVAL